MAYKYSAQGKKVFIESANPKSMGFGIKIPVLTIEDTLTEPESVAEQLANFFNIQSPFK